MPDQIEQKDVQQRGNEDKARPPLVAYAKPYRCAEINKNIFSNQNIRRNGHKKEFFFA
jgi:hypothetical protein